MSQSAVCTRYVEALIEAAETRRVLDRVAADVEGLLSLFRASKDLRDFASDAMFRPDQKKQVLHNLFSGQLDEVTLNFLMVLCDNRRERLLVEMLSAFQAVMDVRRGIATAQVISAQPLTSEQRERLIARLSALSGKQVRLEVSEDAGLKAGFIARMGDLVLDGTMTTQLRRLQRHLTVDV